MNIPAGEPQLDLDALKLPEQNVPPRESFSDRVRARRGTATPKPAKKASERVPASKPGEFVEPLTQFYTMAGMGVAMLDARGGHDDHTCGPTIAENAVKIATAWDELAQKNDQVRKTLRTMLQGSAWAGVIGAHLPIAMAIFSQHMPGSIPPIMKPAPAEDTAEDTAPPVKKVPGRQYRRPPVKKAASNGS